MGQSCCVKIDSNEDIRFKEVVNVRNYRRKKACGPKQGDQQLRQRPQESAYLGPAQHRVLLRRGARIYEGCSYGRRIHTCTREDCNTVFEFAQVGRLMISEERRAVQLAREVDMFRCFERGPAWGMPLYRTRDFHSGLWPKK